jgi:hypothetical protein
MGEMQYGVEFVPSSEFISGWTRKQLSRVVPAGLTAPISGDVCFGSLADM